MVVHFQQDVGRLWIFGLFLVYKTAGILGKSVRIPPGKTRNKYQLFSVSGSAEVIASHVYVTLHC